MVNEYYPSYVPHPGTELRERLEELGMGVKEFALRSGKPGKTIIAVLNGDSAITPDMAVQFENALRTPAHYWLNRQRAFDESIARERRQEVVRDAGDWSKKFPLKQMISLGWMTEASSHEERTAQLLNFFGVSNPGAWEDYYINQELKVAFRISLKQTSEPYALSAWLRRGELQASEISAAEYSANSFKAALRDIKTLMARQRDNFFSELRNICLESGVKVVHTPCLAKAPISGSTRWINDTPLIQLTGRYKRNDNFWFTFFHEAGHILLHGKKDIFLENVKYSELDMVKEKEADKFAIDWTFTEEEEQAVIEAAPLDDQMIRKFAKLFNTHPAMIIGRLHYKKLVPYSLGRSLYQEISFD